jgi:hypothetical protein
MMLTVVQHTCWFSALDPLPQGETFIPQYLITQILASIWNKLVPAGRRKLAVRPGKSWCHAPQVLHEFLSDEKARLAPH